MPEFIYFKKEGWLVPMTLLCVWIDKFDSSVKIRLADGKNITVGVTIDEIVSALNNPANTDRVIVI